MIVYKNKRFMQIGLFPDTDWVGNADYTIPDDSEIAKKIKVMYPNFDFVLGDDGDIVDITAVKPVETVSEPPKNSELSAISGLTSLILPKDDVNTEQTSGNLARYDSTSDTVQYIDVELPSTGMYLIIIDNTNIPEMGAYVAGYAGSYTEVFKMLGNDTYSKVTSSPDNPVAVRIYANDASPIAYHLYKLPFYS